MTYREVTGNLFAGSYPAIGHGCNLVAVMGAGIAEMFRRRWPAMYEEYRLACRNGTLKLGGYTFWASENEFEPVIYCLGTQELPGPFAELHAIRDSVLAALDDCERRGISKLAIPRVGAGIGGLRWEDVQKVLQEAAADHNVELVVVSLPETARAE